uniref:Dirigent protein n=1 Tax=Solanum lycopersicum TaxID=4081 RepID=A0A3Q7EW64_SOLLC
MSNSYPEKNMIDNALTLGPKLSFKIVGSPQEFSDFVFIEGKYNGSIFTIFDWNSVFEKVGEMEEIRGRDFKTGNANVQYDAYVLYY